jgi:hypothetical protein
MSQSPLPLTKTDVADQIAQRRFRICHADLPAAADQTLSKRAANEESELTDGADTSRVP